MTGDVETADAVIDRLVHWASARDAVGAMLLTSTRAVPCAPVDDLSDYDVILVVRDIGPFVTDRRWIEDFGEVLVAYWDPVLPDPETGIEQSGNIVQYADGLKIDFSLWPTELLESIAQRPDLPAELDAGYRVLVDKDGIASTLRAPTYAGYIPSRPDKTTFLTTVNDFFIGAPYVAKCLLRDEVLPAKWCLDYDMRYVYLLPMLEWRMECDHCWAVPVGVNGKGLKSRLAPELWADLEGTYAGASIPDNWESLFRMIALFGRIAREVAEHLGFTYPEDLDNRVTDFVRQMRESSTGAVQT